METGRRLDKQTMSQYEKLKEGIAKSQEGVEKTVALNRVELLAKIEVLVAGSKEQKEKT